VKEACQGDDIDAAAIEAHFALHAVYGLHEAYFIPRGLKSRKEQNEVYAQGGGQVAGALVLARGTRTHQLVSFPMPGGFGDEPHSMGPYGRAGFGKNILGQITVMNTVPPGMKKHVRWRLV
jgi:hypothetical protein